MFTLNIADIMQYGGWAGKQWAVRGDQKDYANFEWLDSGDAPTEQAMSDAELAAAKAMRKAQVKTEARDRILALWPDWKQRNCALGGYDGEYSEEQNVAGATNASPIVIECEGHGFQTGDKVTVASVGGNTAANGSDQDITRVDADHFSLDGSTGNGDYTSGGTVKRQVPLGIKNDVAKVRADSDTAESSIDALETVSAVLAFTW